ncbi:MAG: MotA/TolQ/ExbB proton channel family protein [Syntrophobacterales bacterium]|nr:MotA/TolQ/ExbB proton channel family protein [Syntrophobacterales bacterium]
MDVATFIGIIVGFSLVIAAIAFGGGIGIFFNIPAAMIVLGGTLGITLIRHSLSEFIGMAKVVKNAFFVKAWSYEHVFNLLIDFSNKARKEGILALEEDLYDLKDEFLAKALQMAIDGMEPDSIKEILEKEIDYLHERHQAGAEILETMGTFFPAMGMIGTLIGLVQMLRTISDPSTIGPAMAVALITTFYGAVGANLICLPIAGKLRARSKEETLIKEMIIVGVISIAMGENPRILEQKLHVFAPTSKRFSRFK